MNGTDISNHSLVQTNKSIRNNEESFFTINSYVKFGHNG